jgi:predicted nuclease of predicted toxin-antitoxin system
MRSRSSHIDSPNPVDQNIPPSVCEFVRKRKPHWEVRHVTDVGLQGAADDTIFHWAQSDLSIVITFDEDFADARMYPAGSHAGVVRLRVWPTTIENTETALARLFDSVRRGRLAGESRDCRCGENPRQTICAAWIATSASGKNYPAVPSKCQQRAFPVKLR